MPRLATERPGPLDHAARTTGALWSFGSGLGFALIAHGILSAAQAEALTAAAQQAADAVVAWGTGIAGVAGLVAGLLASFRVAADARDHVTPVTDPRTIDGAPLIPAPLPPPAAPDLEH